MKSNFITRQELIDEIAKLRWYNSRLRNIVKLCLGFLRTDKTREQYKEAQYLLLNK